VEGLFENIIQGEVVFYKIIVLVARLHQAISLHLIWSDMVSTV
jgi:hypothetical protein